MYQGSHFGGKLEKSQKLIKTVCLDARLIESGGIGTYIQNMIEKLHALPFRLIVIVPYHMKEQYNALKNIASIRSRTPIYTIREQIFLPFLIPHCDLFWSPHFNIPIFPIRSRKRLLTLHDVFHLAFLPSFNWIQRIYAKYMICHALNKSHHVITVSQFSKREIIKHTHIQEDKLSVIPLGINTSLFHRSDQEQKRQEIQEKYHLDLPFFLFVGHFNKNLYGLLRAFFELCTKRGHRCSLILVGKERRMKRNLTLDMILANYPPNIRKHVRHLGYVPQKELPFLYQLATAFVFPSFYEGFGLPPLEAMSCGCPALVSKISSLQEVYGDSAYYIDPHVPSSIASGMEKMLTDHSLKAQFIQKGYQRAQAMSWNKTAESHIQIIQDLLK